MNNEMNWDQIVEFEQQDTNLLECFIIFNGVLVASQFLSKEELNHLNDRRSTTRNKNTN